MQEDKQKSSFGWVMSFAGEKKSRYALSVILALCGAVCQVLPFLVMAKMVQQLLSGGRDLKVYLAECGIMAALWLLRVLFHGLSTRTSHVATFRILGSIRKKALEKLAKMPLGEVQRRGTGALKNTLVERIDSVETALAHIIPEFTSNMTVVIATLCFLFFVDWRMALASLITLPVGLLLFSLMMIGNEKSYQRTVEATKNLNETAVEYICGIEVIKVFGKAKGSYEKFAAAVKEGAASYVEWMRQNNGYFTFGLNVMPATLLTILPIGGLLLKNGTLPPADFVLVTIMAMGLMMPLITCLSYQDDLAKLGTVLGEITSILTAEELPRPEKSEATPAGTDICLKNVRFAYEEQEVLHGINATFKAGTVNALVGPSGGGKSTIAKLICSFFDVSGGEIDFGGADIRRLSPEEYDRQIAYVSQDNFLFDDTVMENIRMGNPQATDEEVRQAAKDCGCYDFIMGLEKGFDTVVGGGGSHLSGGEKQRICIARAMLKNAPVVILDEATAYTDPENEALIQSSVARLVQDKTLIVIAHRLSTVMDADQILVIDKGEVAGRGKHQELLCSCPLYQALWSAHEASRDRAEGGAY